MDDMDELRGESYELFGCVHVGADSREPEGELSRAMRHRKFTDPWENESMSFGESVTLLIAIGVLLYLIYALLWPQRF